MTATISQADAILALLHSRPQGITPMDALEEVGCFRLAARISDLRAVGHLVNTTYETAHGKTYARYQLAHTPEGEMRALWGDR